MPRTLSVSSAEQQAINKRETDVAVLNGDHKDDANETKPTIEPSNSFSAEKLDINAPISSRGQILSKDAVQSRAIELGLDLPGWLIEKLATNYNGMTPMERFLVETYEGGFEGQGIRADALVSDSGATYAGSREGGKVYGEAEADQSNC